MPILVIWPFGAFLFYKVAFDMAYFHDLTLVAAILLGVTAGVSILVSTNFHARAEGRYLARLRFGADTRFLGPAFGVFAVNALAFAVLSRLIVFGFSKRLDAEIGDFMDMFGRYGSSAREDYLLFLLICTAPLLVHFVMVAVGVHLQSRVVRQQLAADMADNHP